MTNFFVRSSITLADTLINFAILLILSILTSGCQMEYNFNVSQNICTASNINNYGYYNTYLSPLTYLMGGIALFIFDDWLYLITINLLSVDLVKGKLFMIGTIIYESFNLIYIILFLGLAGGNDSLSIWKNYLQVEFIISIIWTIYRVITIITKWVMMLIYYKRKRQIN